MQKDPKLLLQTINSLKLREQLETEEFLRQKQKIEALKTTATTTATAHVFETEEEAQSIEQKTAEALKKRKRVHPSVHEDQNRSPWDSQQQVPTGPPVTCPLTGGPCGVGVAGAWGGAK